MLKKEYIDKIVFGGIYKCKTNYPCNKYGDSLNDQKYGVWVPIYYEYKDYQDKEHKGYGMIDTYQLDYDIRNTRDKDIDYTSMSKFEIIVKNLTELKNPKKGYWAKYKTSDYYYKAFCELTNSNFDDFELVADLHDYEVTTKPEYYNEEDTITYLKLYQEHAYPYGIHIVKKDAEVNYKYKITNKICESRRFNYSKPSSINDYEKKELLSLEKEAIEKKQEYNKSELDMFIKENDFLAKQREEYNDFMDNLKSDLDEIIGE